MRPFQAILIGVALASALVLTVQADAPENIAARILQAQGEQGLLETWRDWHHDAEHRIVIKYGAGQQEDVFMYRVSENTEWDASEIATAMEGYRETSRSAPEVSLRTEDGVPLVTAVSYVDYDWHGHTGKMRQTDEFVFAPYLGRTVIRSLTTTYDYR
ncbi:hypothetical protein SAMN05444358_11021 [Ruegeria halocynthiae]|uniref:Uncharacterized protein n=1 Tax=Ruegeria halocynthiae TaxID=985054 RepID=A0A1H3E454_9RHOB|nr:hypothetical protein [Ruegeria halocynthiae]SDX72699.1 hypothetical protein SAMN05444358_11021 [Ruegeria halocynthiae]